MPSRDDETAIGSEERGGVRVSFGKNGSGDRQTPVARVFVLDL